MQSLFELVWLDVPSRSWHWHDIDESLDDDDTLTAISILQTIGHSIRFLFQQKDNFATPQGIIEHNHNGKER